MNYENLKDAIVAVIKQNGNEEITGNILQQVLVAMVNSLGNGYQFKGIATPATDPGTPDQRVFYLASAAGTYPNFGFIVSDEICALVYDTAWHKETIIALDQEPTEDSGNLISSGAIYTALQNLADVFMELVEDADEDHIATFDANGQVKDSGLSLDDVAKAKGAFPELFAGFAGNLVDTRSAGTPQSFAFRQSGGDGVNYMRKILGRTEAFNQMVNKVATREDNGVTFTTNADGSVTISGIASAVAASSSTSIFTQIDGHIYLTLLKNATNDICLIGRRTTGFPGTNYGEESHIGTAIGTGDQSVGIVVKSGADFSTPVTVWPMVVDITLEGLGLTTADQFRTLHPLPYYSRASKLINNAATGLETVGFNQWDEEWEMGGINNETGQKESGDTQIRSKNYISVLSGKDYYIKAPSNSVILFAYDADKNFIGEYNNGSWVSSGGSWASNIVIMMPSDACFVRFKAGSTYGTTYNHDICINRSDASRNGIYEPYWKRDIVLGLDNLACHDEDNNAVVVNGLDGVGTAQDELIVENGWGTKINKKMEEVDLGSLNWTYETSTNRMIVNLGTLPRIPKGAGDSNVANIICALYSRASNIDTSGHTGDKIISLNASLWLCVYDSAYSDAATFKAAMAGVKLRYELATPKVLTLDNPIPALIEVDNLGTEKRLPEDTADNPQGPFECDSNYSISTANLVRILSQ